MKHSLNQQFLMKANRILFLVVIIFLLKPLYSQKLIKDPINRRDMMESVRYLSSPEMEGRMPGTEGYDKASKYCADIFKQLNLKAIGDKGFFQYFNIESNVINSASLKLKVDDYTEKNYKLGKDFVCRTFSGSGNIRLPLVFCGYGISELSYDDYANIDVKNKIVLVFKQMPAWKNGDKDFKFLYARDKARIALEKGAAGILLVSLPNDEKPQKPIGSTSEGESKHLDKFPIIHIDLDIADDFFINTGKTIKELQTLIDNNKNPQSFDIGKTVEIKVDATYNKKAKTQNVIAMLEGSDPILKKEYIMYSAHLDHVGKQGNDMYFPGANDNASGVAAVLQIAKAFVASEVKPKRSVIFILFACEEYGGDGSKYLADNFPYNIDNITAMFNLDCIAFGDSIQAGNGKSCPVLWNIVREQDSLNTKQLINKTWAGGGTDLTPFFSKGVPCTYFVTTNSYKHLHLPSDKPETLNAALFEKVVRLAFLSGKYVSLGNYSREKIIKN
ncbi:MAG: M20/M25/M40 family metallo-hydrolase [Bacteroidales bacterium]|nr:M20/M25/M40 family metallo-hydrolase [Bacteroidales bacterium]